MTDLVAGLSSRPLVARSRATPAPGASLDRAGPPLHWPSLAPLVAEGAWSELIEWVEDLRRRYRGLDSYVVPGCWYRHEALVMALQALKDHERAAYGPEAPGTAATDWHRALRDLGALLRQLSAELRCAHGPEDATEERVGEYVARDIARRRRRAATVALGQ